MAANNQVDSLRAKREKLKQEIKEIRIRIEDLKRGLVTFLTKEFELKEALKEVEKKYKKAVKEREEERGKRFREEAERRRRERYQKMAEMHERVKSGRSGRERVKMLLEFFEFLIKKLRGEI